MGLEAVIRRHGLKQREIADRIGVAEETLSRWVRGHKGPNGANLVRLLGHLRKYEPKLQAADLLGRRGRAA